MFHFLLALLNLHIYLCESVNVEVTSIESLTDKVGTQISAANRDGLREPKQMRVITAPHGNQEAVSPLGDPSLWPRTHSYTH